MVYQYQWRINKYPVSAEAAGKHMESLNNKHGAVTPELLLDSSRSEDSVMHPCFEWDDTKAAEKYRVKQALGIICNLTCVKVTGNKDENPTKTRAFVNVSSSSRREKGTFKPIIEAISNSDMRRTVLRNAIEELECFKNKYSSLTELIGVFEEIDKLKKSPDQPNKVLRT